MCKLTVPQLQIFDIILKDCFRNDKNNTCLQPVIKIDNHILSCDFFLYDDSFRPFEIDIDIQGMQFENKLQYNDYIRSFWKATEIKRLKSPITEPTLIFEMILNYVIQIKSFKCISNFAFNVTFLESNVHLPFYRLDPNSTYEIISISEKKA